MNSLLLTLLFAAVTSWFPLPAYEDREAWDSLSCEYHESLIAKGERYLDYEWKVIPATSYLEFERTGDRKAMESRQNANRDAIICLMLAELCEGRGRFLDQIINGAWLAAEQTSWVLSAHTKRQGSHRSLPDYRETLIDLGSARFGSLMALTHHFFHKEFDKADPSISLAIERAVKKNILDPFLNEDENRANWWLGFTRTKSNDLVNNWNPWCNTEVALCFLLMEHDQDRLNAAMDKGMRSIAEYTGYVQQDGACEEGPSYWGHACGKLCDWIQLMYYASDGNYDRRKDPLLHLMTDYISRCHVGDGYHVNFADAAARGDVRAELVWRCGRVCGSRECEDFALYLLGDDERGRFAHAEIRSDETLRALLSLNFNRSLNARADSLNALVDSGRRYSEVKAGLRGCVPAATWYPETEHCFLHGPQGWFFAGKGGYNNESHNHNDCGSCILYIRNTPVLCDAGVETYSRETFGEGRYGIWTMQSDWHNLPMINGSSQIFGREFKASGVECSPNKGLLSMHLETAYMEAARCNRWVRSYKFNMNGTPGLRVEDSFTLTGRVAPDIENFLVKGTVLLPGERCKGRLLKAGELAIVCENDVTVLMRFPSSLTASVEEKPIEDPKLKRIWGTALRRISLTSKEDAATSGRYVFTFSEL